MSRAFLSFVLFLAVSSAAQAQSDPKALLAKYAVAYFEVGSVLRQAKTLESPTDVNRILNKVNYQGNVDAYYSAYRLPHAFLEADVYEVTTLGSPPRLYRVGIRDSVQVLRLYGFVQWDRFVTGIPSNGVDSLRVADFGLYRESRASIDDFVRRAIALTQLGFSPDHVELLSNNFDLEGNVIQGEATVIIRGDENDEEASQWNYTFRYAIPDSGAIHIERVE